MLIILKIYKLVHQNSNFFYTFLKTKNMTHGCNIIGIAIRTKNKDNQAQKDLGKLWTQFFEEKIAEKIPNKISTEIFAIYTDYKSDHTEEYTALIGMPVSSLEEIPDGLIGREFEPEKFEIVTARGEMPKAVATTWAQIWQNDDNLDRKYSYDFEVYGEKSQQEENSEVDIYISIN